METLKDKFYYFVFVVFGDIWTFVFIGLFFAVFFPLMAFLFYSEYSECTKQEYQNVLEWFVKYGKSSEYNVALSEVMADGKMVRYEYQRLDYLDRKLDIEHQKEILKNKANGL